MSKFSTVIEMLDDGRFVNLSYDVDDGFCFENIDELVDEPRRELLGDLLNDTEWTEKEFYFILNRYNCDTSEEL